MLLNNDPPSCGDGPEIDFKNLCRITVLNEWAVRVASTPKKDDGILGSWCVGVLDDEERTLDLEGAKAFVRLWGAHHNKEVGFTDDVQLVCVRW